MSAPLRIAIAGAGAIGGLIGARLARLAEQGEAQVSVWARGTTLSALNQHGWRFVERDGSRWQVRPSAAGSPQDLGIQDVVIVAFKAQALHGAWADLQHLIGPRTRIVSAMNGVPWWWASSLPALGAATLETVDPQGALSRALPVQQVWGAVVHMSARCPEPGVVQHAMGDELILGDPLARAVESPSLDGLAALLRAAGFRVSVSPQIQQAVWSKLWGNLTMNPVSALTGATADRILDDPLVRDLCSQAMREAAEVGQRIGCPVPMTPDERHAVTRKLGAFKTSMLQDVEAQRSIELDAIVGAVREIAQRVEVSTPAVDALLGLTRLMARSRGLYPQ
jgi:2-dehydropantoate 2-reductase